jgi:hypothetical protein
VALCFGHPGLMFSQPIMDQKYSAASMVSMVGDDNMEMNTAYK